MHFASGGRAAPQQPQAGQPPSGAQWALEVIDSMRELGADAAELERFGAEHGLPAARVQAHLRARAAQAQADEASAAPAYGVWAPNWHAITVLCAMANQWHTHIAPSGHLVRTALNLAGWPRDWRQLVAAPLRRSLHELHQQLRTVESAALGWWTEDLSARAARR